MIQNDTLIKAFTEYSQWTLQPLCTTGAVLTAQCCSVLVWSSLAWDKATLGLQSQPSWSLHLFLPVIHRFFRTNLLKSGKTSKGLWLCKWPLVKACLLPNDSTYPTVGLEALFTHIRWKTDHRHSKPEAARLLPADNHQLKMWASACSRRNWELVF